MDDAFSKLLLKMHIRSLGIKLYDRVPHCLMPHPDAMGAYNMDENFIVVSEEILSDGEEIVVLAHELGHAIDVISEPRKIEVHRRAGAHRAAHDEYGLEVPRWATDVLVEREEMAFIIGESVLRELGCDLPECWERLRSVGTAVAPEYPVEEAPIDP